MEPIAVDTSSLVALVSNANGPDVELLIEALTDGIVALPPIVLVESCSNHLTRQRMEALILPMRQLEIIPGHWHRAANLRANILAKKLKASLADTLIAQSCIDHGIALITRDADFRHFAKHGGLKLAIK
jgi:predicted nucleic acid-binding protein